MIRVLYVLRSSIKMLHARFDRNQYQNLFNGFACKCLSRANTTTNKINTHTKADKRSEKKINEQTNENNHKKEKKISNENNRRLKYKRADINTNGLLL